MGRHRSNGLPTGASWPYKEFLALVKPWKDGGARLCMMLLKRLAVGPPSAMRLAAGLPISEIKIQVVAIFGNIGDIIVLQMSRLQLATLLVLGTQIYGK